MRSIDGSRGEGGGQILRTALGLSLVTGEPFRMHSIRAGRQKPGLLRQHLAAVLAAAEVGGARVEGAALGSCELTFRPGALRGGSHRFPIGSAGSASLVLQTLLPALLAGKEPSSIEVEGGTHNPKAPPFEFLEKAFLPLLARMGARASVSLERYGFYPRGGGLLRLEVEPSRLARLDLEDGGPVVFRRARALVARLPLAIAEREAARLRAGLGSGDCEVRAESTERSVGPGNVVTIEVERKRLTEVFTSVGERGLPAEAVADAALAEARAYLAHGAPVGEHLADQLILPMALGEGGAFRTGPPSLHARTQADTIRRFLPVRIDLRQDGPTFLCVVEPA